MFTHKVRALEAAGFQGLSKNGDEWWPKDTFSKESNPSIISPL